MVTLKKHWEAGSNGWNSKEIAILYKMKNEIKLKFEEYNQIKIVIKKLENEIKVL